MSSNLVNPDTIFANNEMSLRDIEIYGFDYDYTLAFYSSQLHNLIFNIARDILITKHRVGLGVRVHRSSVSIDLHGYRGSMGLAKIFSSRNEGWNLWKCLKHPNLLVNSQWVSSRNLSVCSQVFNCGWGKVR